MGKTSALALLAGLALALGGCTGGGGPEPTTTMPEAGTQTTSTSISPAGGPESNAGQAPASNIPDSTGATADSAHPTVLPTNASVTVYYIAEGDGGISGPEVGCGDSAVAVTSPTVSYTDPVEAALRVLLAADTMEIGQSGLRNALWQSDLTVASVDRSGTTIAVNLEGTMKLGGECDIPRVEEQLQLTADTAAGAPVAITINGKPMAEALSLK